MSFFFANFRIVRIVMTLRNWQYTLSSLILFGEEGGTNTLILKKHDKNMIKTFQCMFTCMKMRFWKIFLCFWFNLYNKLKDEYAAMHAYFWGWVEDVGTDGLMDWQTKSLQECGLKFIGPKLIHFVISIWSIHICQIKFQYCVSQI